MEVQNSSSSFQVILKAFGAFWQQLALLCWPSAPLFMHNPPGWQTDGLYRRVHRLYM